MHRVPAESKLGRQMSGAKSLKPEEHKGLTLEQREHNRKIEERKRAKKEKRDERKLG